MKFSIELELLPLNFGRMRRPRFPSRIKRRRPCSIEAKMSGSPICNYQKSKAVEKLPIGFVRFTFLAPLTTSINAVQE
jgi:hypothetical protein